MLGYWVTHPDTCENLLKLAGNLPNLGPNPASQPLPRNRAHDVHFMHPVEASFLQVSTSIRQVSGLGNPVTQHPSLESAWVDCP